MLHASWRRHRRHRRLSAWLRTPSVSRSECSVNAAPDNCVATRPGRVSGRWWRRWQGERPLPPPHPPSHHQRLSNDCKEMKRVFSASVKKLVMTTKPIRQHDRSSCVESLREHNESGCYGAAVYRRRDDRNELIQLNLRRIGQIILACATGFNVDNCWLGKKKISIQWQEFMDLFWDAHIEQGCKRKKRGGGAGAESRAHRNKKRKKRALVVLH